MSHLPDLPPSSDEFWDGDKQVIDINKTKKNECSHSFIARNAGEVECKHCKIGFYLGHRGTLKNEHIYIDGKLVIQTGFRLWQADLPKAYLGD